MTAMNRNMRLLLALALIAALPAYWAMDPLPVPAAVAPHSPGAIWFPAAQALQTGLRGCLHVYRARGHAHVVCRARATQIGPCDIPVSDRATASRSVGVRI